MRSKLLTIALVVGMAFLLVTNPVVSNAAGGLTKSAVKKIATKSAAKVIAKQAPNLTVSHASTATSATSATTAATAATAQNATLLGGQPAATYLTTSYRYALPAKAAAAGVSYAFPGLPAGSYLVNYSTVFTFTATSGTPSVSCQVTPTSAGTGYVAAVFGVVAANFATISASGSMTTTTVGAPKLECFSSGGTITSNTAGNFDNAVTFTRIDTNNTGASANLAGAATHSNLTQ